MKPVVSGAHPPPLTKFTPSQTTAPLQILETARCKYAG